MQAPFAFYKNKKEQLASIMDKTEEVRIGRLLKETTFISTEISSKEQDDLKTLLRK